MELPILLLDANVLLGLTDLDLSGRRSTVDAVRRLIAEGFQARCLAGQLREMYVVLTRLGQNGYEVPAARASQVVLDVVSLAPLVTEPDEVLSTWTSIVAERGTIGVRAHDAWIIATAHVLGASILTDDRQLAASAGVPTFQTDEVS